VPVRGRELLALLLVLGRPLLEFWRGGTRLCVEVDAEAVVVGVTEVLETEDRGGALGGRKS
jgi:hypothetical protein